MTTPTPAAGMTSLPAAGTNWRSYALCAEVDPELFFPQDGSSAIAKRVCLSCEVRLQCQEFAIEHGEKGIWGGLSEEQRKATRRVHDPVDRAA